MVINFFGRRGSGKTTALKGQLADCRSPVVIIDVLGNFDSIDYYQTEELDDTLYAIKEYFLSRKNEENPYKVICLKTSDPTQAADYISSAIWEINGGTIILDEVDAIRIKENSCFDSYIRYGRNHHGDLLTGCRRPAELSKNITAAANKFYCFQTHEPRDIEYFEDAVFGEKARELMHMQPYSGLFMDYDNRIQGSFYIDIEGTIYHVEENPLI